MRLSQAAQLRKINNKKIDKQQNINGKILGGIKTHLLVGWVVSFPSFTIVPIVPTTTRRSNVKTIFVTRGIYWTNVSEPSTSSGHTQDTGDKQTHKNHLQPNAIT